VEKRRVFHRYVDKQKIAYYQNVLEEYYKNKGVAVAHKNPRKKYEQPWWDFGTYHHCDSMFAYVRLFKNSFLKKIELDNIIEIQPYTPTDDPNKTPYQPLLNRNGGNENKE